MFTLVTLLLLSQSARRRQRGLRAIPAYEHLPLLIGAAIEADRPMHLSFGGAGIGGENTVLSLVSAELFYQIAQRAATGETAPLFTMSDPTAIPLAQDTLRRAYFSRNRIERYDGGSIQWYPSGPQSLAFAAALTAVQHNDRVISNVLAGSFGAEMALVLDAATRRDVTSIATSDRLDGQAVAFAMSDYPLIGEEVFAAGAYLQGSGSQLGGVAATDVLRWLLILFLVLITANTLLDNQVFTLIQQVTRPLFGGG